ncbi:MAG: HAD family acid phosphatase [Fidelibacterota bacterium]
MIRSFLILLLCAGLWNQETLPNDIRWVRESGEYNALCRQTYRLAWEQLKPRLQSSAGHVAIVMDLDETVLDNSFYQVEITEKGEGFSMDTWAEWVNRAEAGAVPGAAAFIDSVRTLKNVYLIFISNRMAERTEITRENMKSLGLYDPADVYLLRIDSQDKKYVRRNEVFTGTGRMKNVGPLKVVGWFGDALGDFPSEVQEADYGHSWFVLPNPMYGKW